jgi:uncharacterized protein (TIGR02391 family)
MLRSKEQSTFSDVSGFRCPPGFRREIPAHSRELTRRAASVKALVPEASSLALLFVPLLLTSQIRQKTNLVTDGHELVDGALQAPKNGYPLLAINKHSSPSEQTEQKGFALMVEGMFSMFRNLLAHGPKADRHVSAFAYLDWFSLTWSICFHRLFGRNAKTVAIPIKVSCTASIQSWVGIPPTE